MDERVKNRHLKPVETETEVFEEGEFIQDLTTYQIHAVIGKEGEALITRKAVDFSDGTLTCEDNIFPVGLLLPMMRLSLNEVLGYIFLGQQAVKLEYERRKLNEQLEGIPGEN